MSDTNSQGTNNVQQGFGSDNQSSQERLQSYGAIPIQKDLKPTSYGTIKLKGAKTSKHGGNNE